MLTIKRLLMYNAATLTITNIKENYERSKCKLYHLCLIKLPNDSIKGLRLTL